MTDAKQSSVPTADTTLRKRSLSPDEGEIIEDVKRPRLSPSPPVKSGGHNADSRRHRVVYEGGNYGRGYTHRDRGGYSAKGYDDSQRYRDWERHHERPPHHGDRRGRGFVPKHYHRERSGRRHSPSRGSHRNRSLSSERIRESSRSRDRTSSPRSSSRHSRSPSPQSRKVQFSSGTKAPAYASASVLQLTPSQEELLTDLTIVDEEALIKARRRKREAILAKYQGQSTPSIIDNLKIQSTDASPVPGPPAPRIGESSPSNSSNSVESPRPASREITPDFEPSDEKTFELISSTKHGSDTQDGPSAADYDPTQDMKIDDQRRHKHENFTELASADYDENKATDQDVLIPEKAPPVTTTTPTNEEEDDMFATPVSPKSRPKTKEEIANKSAPVIAARQLDASLLDTWHDPEGYYIVILGEILHKRYVVQANLGKGMFSSVVRCIDNEQNGKHVAIKIIRNNEAMRKAGLKEIGILEKIMNADPDGRKHVIRLEGSFDHKGHLCLVFENLSLNLREVLKRFGRDVGINLKAVRAYAQQMFVGLSLLRKCNLVHADLKPDNILINDNRTTLKICDLGSATDISDYQLTDYLVSRFYRAPEIILGIHYDYAIDVWSIGCTLFELYTGKILFPGRTNNQMLRLMIECRGRFPSKMLRKGQYVPVHFNDQLVFMSQEVDAATKNEVVKPLNLQKPIKDLKQRVTGGGTFLDGEAALLSSFVDFLGRCLELNPEKRITPAEAFRHPFIKM